MRRQNRQVNALYRSGSPVPIPGSNATTPRDCDADLPVEGAALEIHPNPLVGSAQVTFRLGSAEPVDLAVYDLLGRRIRVLRHAVTAAGPHRVVWDGADDRGVRVPSGVYMTRVMTPTRTEVRRTVVVR